MVNGGQQALPRQEFLRVFSCSSLVRRCVTFLCHYHSHMVIASVIDGAVGVVQPPLRRSHVENGFWIRATSRSGVSRRVTHHKARICLV